MQNPLDVRFTGFTSYKIAAFFSLLFLCSCQPKKEGTSKATRLQYESGNDLHLAIPAPIGFRCTGKRLSTAQANPLLIVRYEGTQALDRTTSFYRREMEAAGWDLSNFSSDQEGLFFCRKGRQECAVSIRKKGKTIVTFSYKTKTPTEPNPTTNAAQINKPI